jgi:hypothetical protein
MAKYLELVPIAFTVLTAVTLAQTPSFKEDLLHGRRALVLENDQMRIATLPGGGFIGEVRFKSSDPKKSINLMRVPHYQTIDPYTYDIARDGDRYGTGMQRRLMSGYMGHFVAFPQFAAASEAELAQDYGQHGEAIAVAWQTQKVEPTKDRVSLRYSADLPKTHFKIERTITLPSDETVAYVEESIENLEAFGRPVQWTQHVTFGPPFVALNKNFVDASVQDAVVRSGEATTKDLRVFSGTANTWLMDGSKPAVYFTMYNVDYPVLIGYIFESAPNRWVLDWQENQRMDEKPWDRKVIARGICIGDSVISGLRNAVQRGSQLGTPVFSWIDARQTRSQKYAFFLADIPIGFKGVSNLRVENDRIVIVERETGAMRSIKAAGLGASLQR